jgi:hypothetical protein
VLTGRRLSRPIGHPRQPGQRATVQRHGRPQHQSERSLSRLVAKHFSRNEGAGPPTNHRHEMQHRLGRSPCVALGCGLVQPVCDRSRDARCRIENRHGRRHNALNREATNSRHEQRCKADCEHIHALRHAEDFKTKGACGHSASRSHNFRRERAAAPIAGERLGDGPSRGASRHGGASCSARESLWSSLPMNTGDDDSTRGAEIRLSSIFSWQLHIQPATMDR